MSGREKMTIYQGKGVSPGIAIGKIHCFRSGGDVRTLKRRTVDDPAEELKRFHVAQETASSELKQLYEKALREVGETNAEIFEIHRMMIHDRDFADSVETIITTQRINAEAAVAKTEDTFALMFSSVDDAYLRERAADVHDISARLLRILQAVEGEEPVADAGGGNLIICASDLTPSETVTLDKQRVTGFATLHGSGSSHTAILARTMGIPAVVGLRAESGAFPPYEMEGADAVLDGTKGCLYLDPDMETKSLAEQEMNEEARRRELYRSLHGAENVTRGGRHIEICANIAGVDDLGAALASDASGIGLMRSEFLYLGAEDFPSEDVQFAAYKKVLESMPGKRVVIRTLDIGADKKLAYFQLGAEENPALGYRAIRLCLQREDIFRPQLRALCRASVYGRLAIMFPMVISIGELRQAKALLQSTGEELRAEGISIGSIETGVMIETPASAVIADLLVEEVDFFSVGTNDLTQYTLAADRQNPKVESYPWLEDGGILHPAVERLLRHTVKCAHRKGKWVGVCGEMAADLRLTELFLDIGVDELSVSPPSVLPLRAKVRELP